MRASLAFLVALALGGLTSHALAEGAAPSPAASSKSDDALSPTTLPKARQGVKEDAGSNHVDALSRDETRRLERLRAKAAGGKPQAAPPAKPEPEQAAKDARPSSPAAAPEAAAPPKEATRAPAPDAQKKTKSVAKVAPSRPTQHVARRARAPAREVAETRRSSRRAYARPSGGREWREAAAPRVGDVVPPDVPLFPVGPAYGQRPYPVFPRGDAYPPRRQAYAPGPPPFPRVRDDDNDDEELGPPRRRLPF